MLKVQEAKSILRVDFTLSKYPYFDSTYLVKVRFSLDLAVYIQRFTVKAMKIAFVSFLMNAIYGLDDLNDKLHNA